MWLNPQGTTVLLRRGGGGARTHIKICLFYQCLICWAVISVSLLFFSKHKFSLLDHVPLINSFYLHIFTKVTLLTWTTSFIAWRTMKWKITFNIYCTSQGHIALLATSYLTVLNMFLFKSGTSFGLANNNSVQCCPYRLPLCLWTRHLPIPPFGCPSPSDLGGRLGGVALGWWLLLVYFWRNLIPPAMKWIKMPFPPWVWSTLCDIRHTQCYTNKIPSLPLTQRRHINSVCE